MAAYDIKLSEPYHRSCSTSEKKVIRQPRPSLLLLIGWKIILQSPTKFSFATFLGKRILTLS